MSETEPIPAAPSTGGRIVVTPAGHDLAVWRTVLADAPRMSLHDLLAVLGAAGDAATAPLTLVLASAHPDDETLGGGRLAHVWSREVGPVTGVLATLGEACVDHVMTRPPGLAQRRLSEWRLATARLGFSTGSVLGLPDGSLAARETELTDGLRAAVLEQVEDGPVVMAAPWRGDPHPDHQAVGRAAARVADELAVPLLEYPVWMTYWSTPRALQAAHQELLVLRTGTGADTAHQHATEAFVSQIEPLGPYATPVVPAALLEHHRQQLVILAAGTVRAVPS